uniref:Zonadhesin n=1 Tax=Peronospora matthiolae TaxID=2874970 RepID=A0AAV1T474_9STRA
MLPVKYLVAIIAGCVSHTCVVNGGGYHAAFQEELMPAQTVVDAPHPEVFPSVAQADDGYALTPTETLQPELVEGVSKQEGEYTPVQTEATPCPELPTPALDAEVKSEVPVMETALQNEGHASVQSDATPCPELPTPALDAEADVETPVVETPVQEEEHVVEEHAETPCPELPTPALDAEVKSEVPVVETPAQVEEHVEVQTETPGPVVAPVSDTPPHQPEETSVPDTIHEGTTGEHPIPGLTIPCPKFTLVPEIAPVEMIEAYSTPAPVTPCPVFTLVPETDLSLIETTTEAYPTPALAIEFPDSVHVPETHSDLTHVQHDISPDSYTSAIADVLVPYLTEALVENSGPEQTDEVVEDSHTNPMQSEVDQTDQSTGFVDTGVDAIVDTGVDAILETIEDAANAITTDATDIVITN